MLNVLHVGAQVPCKFFGSSFKVLSPLYRGFLRNGVQPAGW
jgi:hypothetical protein